MTVTTAGRTAAGAAEWAVCRAAAVLAERVRTAAASIPTEDHDWLAGPMADAAAAAAGQIATAWQHRRRPDLSAEHLSAAEADLHEVQTWALLALRHHHWSADVADDVDRRCEAALDTLADLAHAAARGRPAAAVGMAA